MLTQPTNSPTIEEMAKAYCTAINANAIKWRFWHSRNLVVIDFIDENNLIRTKYLKYDNLYNAYIKGRI